MFLAKAKSIPVHEDCGRLARRCLQRAVGKALPMDVMETGHNFWPHPDNNMYL